MKGSVAFFAVALLATGSHATLTVEQSETAITVRGDHFAIASDLTKGGEITSLDLFDGTGWNDVFGDPATSLPRLAFSDGAATYTLANDPTSELIVVESASGRVRFAVTGTPKSAEGAVSPWGVTLTYEVYAEGAVFIDVDCELVSGEFDLANASVSFAVADAIRYAPKFRDDNVSIPTGGFPSARVAFGLNAGRSYTNEVEVILERKHAMCGAADMKMTPGFVTWTLGGGERLAAPFRYQNRLALGLGAAVAGKPKSNVVGQRVYHWVNWLDTENWYPTNDQIDTMVACGATMLILHHEWMLQRGSNGYPHADYSVVRNHDDMVRAIDYAHAKGLRVGLYMRGVEMYALDSGFFQKYCKRDWDGIYTDWHGPGAVSWHENKYNPETTLGDTHFSEDGSYVPAKEYFLFTKRQRDIVGPGGFLIGHQGSFNSGVFANLCFDAYLPGETGSDRRMLSDRDEAAYKGMLGGGVCMPWTLDLPLYRNAEGTAKMAAWGLHPHLVLGIKSRQSEGVVFSNDPDDSLYAFVLPYWRILAQIDVEKATVYNLPSQNVEALTTSNPDFAALVYKESDELFLVIVANLGAEGAQATLSLNTDILGMSGEYRATRIDAATGASAPHGTTTGVITTSGLPQWEIEGYKLMKQ